MSKEIFNIESRYSSEIKFSSVNYDDFNGTSKNDFILFLIKKNFNLSSTDLREADLSEADLSEADLSEANLREANLYKADLREADLSEADLREADLSEANLYKADLSEANLREANLREADLSEADLSEANLREADLREANLYKADLREAKIEIYSKWKIFTIALIPSPKLITDYEIKIGCKQKSIENWDIWFSSTDTFDTPRNTENFIRIEAEYKATKAYLVHLCDELAKLEV